MAQTARSVICLHLAKMRFLKRGQVATIFSMALSPSSAQSVRSSMRRASKMGALEGMLRNAESLIRGQRARRSSRRLGQEVIRAVMEGDSRSGKS